MVGGRLGDTLGHPLIMKSAMLFFNLFTVLCALTRNKVALVAGRALQGMFVEIIFRW